MMWHEHSPEGGPPAENGIKNRTGAIGPGVLVMIRVIGC